LHPRVRRNFGFQFLQGKRDVEMFYKRRGTEGTINVNKTQGCAVVSPRIDLNYLLYEMQLTQIFLPSYCENSPYFEKAPNIG
jgi:hypothetical protein